MAQLLYWQDGVYGKRTGTVQCIDGHVIFAQVPESRKHEADDLIRRFANSLVDATRPTTAQVCAFLEGEGIARVEHNGHIAFGLPAPPEEVAEPSSASTDDASKKPRPRKGKGAKHEV